MYEWASSCDTPCSDLMKGSSSMASSPAASVLGGLGMQVMMSAVSTQKTPSSLQVARFEGTVCFQSAWPVADLQVRSSVASEEPPLSDSSWPLVVV